MSAPDDIEPFPALSPIASKTENAPDNVVPSSKSFIRSRMTSSGENARPSRSQSLKQSFVASNPPLGMWQATGEVGSKIPTLPEIHDGSYGETGWSPEGQLERRGTNPHEIHRRTSRAKKDSSSSKITATTAGHLPSQRVPYVEGTTGFGSERDEVHQGIVPSSTQDKSEKAINIMHVLSATEGPDENGTYPNGYRFPKSHTWSQSIVIGLMGLWRFFITPIGFLITIYCLNVVGWGAMIFFLLVEAAPAMCHPSCGDKYSARNVWIEIDAQVLTALFCVTAFGLIPWRFRDFYYLIRWRFGNNAIYHRKLAGIYRSWYRLPGSEKLAETVAPPPVYNERHPQCSDDPPPYTEDELREFELNPSLPLPPSSIPDPPLTGIRASATRTWNLDVVIWMYMLNTWIQGALCGIMWGMNRFNRPSWATGLLITIGCITGIVAGIVVFVEGSKVKKMEGIPVKEYDIVESVEDYRVRKAEEDAKKAKKQQKRTKPDGQDQRMKN